MTGVGLKHFGDNKLIPLPPSFPPYPNAPLPPSRVYHHSIESRYLTGSGRGGHRACFHATMLSNTVIKVTFGDLRGRQISGIIF